MLQVHLRLTLAVVLLLGLVPAAQSQICDVDADADIDRADVADIFAARGTLASGSSDARDADGDGAITVNDARACVLRCDLPRCRLVTPIHPPTAVAGPDQSRDLGETVQLDGSASFDLDGDPISFDWRVAAPDGSAAPLSDSASPMPSFLADQIGDYIAVLVVNDGVFDSPEDDVLISVGDLPPAPRADAGPDRSARVGDTVQLDGSGSSDPEGRALTWRWSLTAPTGSVAVLDDDTAVTPTFVADVDGSYTADLIVNNGLFDSAPDSASIAVDTNTRPVADAGTGQSVDPGTRVTLDGSGSRDADGDPLTFRWSLSAPPGSDASLADPTSVTPSFTPDEDGTYIAQLIVNDGRADSRNPGTVTINVPDNTRPVADAGEDARGILGEPVSLDGSASFDRDGDSLTYRWSVLSPDNGSLVLQDPASVMPGFVPSTTDDVVIQLVVNDGVADSDPDTVLVRIEPGNVPPAALVDALSTNLVGDRVELDGSRSFDLDGDELTFRWSLSVPPGSGASIDNITAPSPGFVPDVRGAYVAQLIVNDGEFDSEPTTVLVVIDGNNIPVANAGADQAAFSGNTIQLDGSASSDRDGDPLTYLWSLTRPAGSGATLSDPTAQRPSFVADVIGEYVPQLVVNDAMASSPPDSSVIDVSQDPDIGNPTLPDICGRILSGSIDAAGEQDVLSFDANAGNRISMAFTVTSSFGTFVTARMTLFSPAGDVLGTFDANTQRVIDLPQDGTYRMRVNASNLTSSGAYNIGIDCLSPAGPIDATLACGDLQPGEIGASAEQDLYAFTGNAGDRLSMTHTVTSSFGTFNFSRLQLFAPDGEALDRLDANTQRVVTLPADGTYLLRVNAHNLTSTGAYNIGIDSLAPAGPFDATLACDSVQAGTIEASGEQDLLRFDASAGDRVSLTATVTASFGTFNFARMRIFAPDGTAVATIDANGQQLLDLSATGTFVLRINANNLVSAGAYRIDALCF